ncbi:DeoR family transcriptional regulator [Streptomyces abyssalis]|uniref:DeoR family transcriptional regulator n=1 Tax=Streptomyces abyssalis TaxID=933944 RepID=A0A1E7JK56_9ACTN|nr:DeoR/GlpR family DNA-binding transcription regulator [Streptomyces abyssalis]OEU87999.1 DeoR family transcriptional regulator [Streptomyces abyssalis]OEU90861.1 DeoR family transcriptional regulator [Streptomyces abyssalis]
MSSRRRAARPQESRQQTIAEYVAENGSATANELAELTGVSVMTVHRDVDDLARRGLLRKFRGGVSAQPSSVFESDVEYRLGARLEQKQAIARCATGLVEPGTSLLLDDSTTALQLARRLEQFTPLTVVTNYRRAIDELCGVTDMRLIALGGEYSRTHDSFNGLSCTEAIARVHVDVAFVSTSAMSTTMTFHQEQEIVQVKRAMLASASKRVLLMDSGKLARTALHQLAPLSGYDDLVVDDGAAPEVLAELREAVRVHVAETDRS